jgi:hypothetical protein
MYQGADTGLTKPSVSFSGGALVATVDTGVPSTMYPYAYFGVPFAACVDASAFTGVKFNISGTLSTGCSIQFSTIDKEHNTVSNGGTCMATSCYASAKIFTLPSTAMDVTVPFLMQTGGGTDAANPVVTPADVTGVQWQVNPAVGDAGGCTGSVSISNISFVH